MIQYLIIGIQIGFYLTELILDAYEYIVSRMSPVISDPVINFTNAEL